MKKIIALFLLMLISCTSYAKDLFDKFYLDNEEYIVKAPDNFINVEKKSDLAFDMFKKRINDKNVKIVYMQEQENPDHIRIIFISHLGEKKVNKKQFIFSTHAAIESRLNDKIIPLLDIIEEGNYKIILSWNTKSNEKNRRELIVNSLCYIKERIINITEVHLLDISKNRPNIKKLIIDNAEYYVNDFINYNIN